MLFGEGPPDLPSLLPHFDSYVTGGDPYNALLSTRLRLYRLTRQSPRRCFNHCDGTRLGALDVPLVPILSSLYDSLCCCCVTGIRGECAAAVAPKIIALRDLVQRQVHNLAYLSSEGVAPRNVRLPCLPLETSVWHCLPLETSTGLWSAAFH